MSAEAPSRADQVVHRVQVRQQVSNCRKCGLWRVSRGPIPFRGESPATLAVVGEAPGEREDEEGKPFVGPSGALATAWLSKAGIDLADTAWLNVVSCFPKRAPAPEEVTACRSNLISQLAVVQPRFLLILGGVALNATLPGSWRIGELRGLWFYGKGLGVASSPLAISTWHPSAVLRNNVLATDVEQDLALLSLVMRLTREDDAYDGPAMPQFCYKKECPNDPVGDTQGVPWCSQHTPK